MCCSIGSTVNREAKTCGIRFDSYSNRRRWRGRRCWRWRRRGSWRCSAEQFGTRQVAAVAEGPASCNEDSLRKRTAAPQLATLDSYGRVFHIPTLSSSQSSSSRIALQASLAKLPRILEVATLAPYGLRTGLRWLRSWCVGIAYGLPLRQGLF